MKFDIFQYLRNYVEQFKLSHSCVNFECYVLQMINLLNISVWLRTFAKICAMEKLTYDLVLKLATVGQVSESYHYCLPMVNIVCQHLNRQISVV